MEYGAVDAICHAIGCILDQRDDRIALLGLHLAISSKACKIFVLVATNHIAVGIASICSAIILSNRSVEYLIKDFARSLLCKVVFERVWD